MQFGTCTRMKKTFEGKPKCVLPIRWRNQRAAATPRRNSCRFLPCLCLSDPFVNKPNSWENQPNNTWRALCQVRGLGQLRNRFDEHQQQYMGKAGPKPPRFGTAVTTTALLAFNTPQQDISIPSKAAKHQVLCLGTKLHQQLLKRAKKTTSLIVQFLIKAWFLAGMGQQPKKLKSNPQPMSHDMNMSRTAPGKRCDHHYIYFM